MLYLLDAHSSHIQLVRQTNGGSRDDKPHLSLATLNAFLVRQCPDYDKNFSVETPISHHQLDEIAFHIRLETLKERSNKIHPSRLLVAAAPHSGAWLDAITVKSHGLLLSDEAVHFSVALRLERPVCLPRQCRCRHMVNSPDHHKLSCLHDLANYLAMQPSTI